MLNLVENFEKKLWESSEIILKIIKKSKNFSVLTWLLPVFPFICADFASNFLTMKYNLNMQLCKIQQQIYN